MRAPKGEGGGEGMGWDGGVEGGKQVSRPPPPPALVTNWLASHSGSILCTKALAKQGVLGEGGGGMGEDRAWRGLE